MNRRRFLSLLSAWMALPVVGAFWRRPSPAVAFTPVEESPVTDAIYGRGPGSESIQAMREYNRITATEIRESHEIMGRAYAKKVSVQMDRVMDDLVIEAFNRL